MAAFYRDVAPTIHVQAASKAGKEALKNYVCKMDGTHMQGPWNEDGTEIEPPQPAYAGEDLPTTLLPFQEFIMLETDKDKPSDRHINWVYDPEGKIGKSKFIKIMAYHRAGTFQWLDLADHKDMVQIIVGAGAKKTYFFDLPRTQGKKIAKEDMAMAIEQVKNGMVQSKKWQGQSLIWKHPHLWVFANELPDNWWSDDRAIIWRIDRDTMDFTKDSYAKHEEVMSAYWAAQDRMAQLATRAIPKKPVRSNSSGAVAP